jgi:hypothetical protein
MQGKGCIPSESRTSGWNPAAAAGRPDVVAADLQRREMEAGGGGGGWGGPAPALGIGRGTREQLGSVAATGGTEGIFAVAALKCPSRQRLARVGGRARFALSTPTSAGQGRADGGAPKFFCGSGKDGGSVPCNFLAPTRKPAVILPVEAIWGVC